VTDSGQHFIDACRHYLRGDYLPKIRRALANLPQDDLWWRPNPESNSVGNLVLHLAGNVRQWIVSGVGGRPDIRKRAEEFAADGTGDASVWTAGTLLEYLAETLEDVDQVLAEMDPESLLEPRVIQGQEVTVLEGLFHAVEHFSMHTGQIIYVTKLRSGLDLRFYDVRDGIATRNW